MTHLITVDVDYTWEPVYVTELTRGDLILEGTTRKEYIVVSCGETDSRKIRLVIRDLEHGRGAWHTVVIDRYHTFRRAQYI